MHLLVQLIMSNEDQEHEAPSQAGEGVDALPTSEEKPAKRKKTSTADGKDDKTPRKKSKHKEEKRKKEISQVEKVPAAPGNLQAGPSEAIEPSTHSLTGSRACIP